jgi:hypothetical protein
MRLPWHTKALVFAAMAFGFMPAHAAALKKVLVLDFKNILKKAEFNYLEGSITDAVRSKLKQKFAFQEIDRTNWLAKAEENFIIEEDLYTYSAAMNLGIAAKQDVVIYGGYVVENKKNGEQELRARVRILDLGNKREISDFEIKNPIDASIFDAVEKIADRIVKEAAAVLPNKDDADRFKEEIQSYNQLSLRGQFAPVAIGANRTVTSTGQFAGTDFKNTAGFAFDMHHFGIWKEQLGVFGGGSVRISNDQFSYSIDGSPAPSALLNFAAQAGLAWRQKINTKFYLQPFLGGGVQYDIMKFNFDSSTVAVTNTAGQSVSAGEYKLFSPFVATGLRVGFFITAWLTAELGAHYAASFYSSAMGQSVYADLGVGFRL